jgi:hypothetical protein
MAGEGVVVVDGFNLKAVETCVSTRRNEGDARQLDLSRADRTALRLTARPVRVDASFARARRPVGV